MRSGGIKMTQYEFIVKNGEIKLWTNNTELLDDVKKYIENCIDAINYRGQLNKVKRVEAEE